MEVKKSEMQGFVRSTWTLIFFICLFHKLFYCFVFCFARFNKTIFCFIFLFARRHGRVQHLNERWSLSAFHALSSVSTVTSIRSCPGVVSIQMSAQGWKLLLLNEVHYEEMLSLEFINSWEKWQHIDEGIKMTYFKTVGHCYDFTSELRWKKNLSTFSTTFFSHYCESGEENRLCW